MIVYYVLKGIEMLLSMLIQFEDIFIFKIIMIYKVGEG